MWLRRKKVNRRLGRVHVLDVKLRSDQVRQTRLRWGVLAFGVMLGTGFGLYVLWRAGDWALNQLVYQNPAFAIREVEVQTDGVIAAAQLRRWANVKPGENLLALDLARVKRDSGTDSFHRHRFRRAHSAADLALAGDGARSRGAGQCARRSGPAGGVDMRVFHLDAEGYVMPPIDPRQRTKPTGRRMNPSRSLTGLKLTDLQLGPATGFSRRWRPRCNLISEFAGSPMAGLGGPAANRRERAGGPGGDDRAGE